MSNAFNASHELPARVRDDWTNEHGLPLRFYRIPAAGLELRVVYQGVASNHHRFHVCPGRVLGGGSAFLPTRNPRRSEGHNPIIEQVGLVPVDASGITSGGEINDEAWRRGIWHALNLMVETKRIDGSGLHPGMGTVNFDPRFDGFAAMGSEEVARYGPGAPAALPAYPPTYGAFGATKRVSACPQPEHGEFRWLHAEACINRRGSKKDVPVLRGPEQFRDFLLGTLRAEIESGQEWFGIVTVDVRLKPTAVWTIFKGGVTNTPVFPSLVFQAALLVPETHGFILWHTHPSGDPGPSPDDRNLTERVRAGAELIGLLCRDHVILAPGGGFYSFVEHGLWRQ